MGIAAAAAPRRGRFAARGIAALTALARREYWLLRIVRMRILDREYFEILAGQSFDSDRAAIRFYLHHERDSELALALSPLIESDWMHRSSSSTDASWYAQLLRDEGLFSTSPYFDATAYVASGPFPTLRTTLAAVRHFLAAAQLDPGLAMPVVEEVRGDTRTWSECRAVAITAARGYVEQMRLRRPRVSEEWDEAAERRFVASIVGGGGAVATPLVTVIMPTRDRVDAIGAAIRSVQGQTYSNWELIVIDDGSTDGTREHVESEAASDARVRLVSIPASGVSAARNRGLSLARGTVIAFLDSDNAWLPRFLEYSVTAMQVFSRDATHSAMRIRRDDGIVRYRGIDGTRDDLLYAGNFIDLNSLVISASLISAVGGFNESVRRWVDYDMLLSLPADDIPRYLPFIGVEYDDRASSDRITGSESDGWEDAVLATHLVDWDELAMRVPERAAGRVSILVPTYGDWRLTTAALLSVIDTAEERELEIIVIDNGSRRHVSAILGALFGGLSWVRVVRMARNLNFALANDYALSLSRGEYVVALNNDTEVSKGWLEPLIRPLERNMSVLGSQPLLLYPDGSIQTAGTVFAEDGVLPRHFLSGYAAEYAAQIDPPTFSAVTAAALCMRASDMVALHGFDPLYTNGLEDVDLCLRALELRHGSFLVVRESVVFHHEGKTPNRGRAVVRNRALFLDRWTGSFPPSDRWRFDALGITADF